MDDDRRNGTPPRRWRKGTEGGARRGASEGDAASVRVQLTVRPFCRLDGRSQGFGARRIEEARAVRMLASVQGLAFMQAACEQLRPTDSMSFLIDYS